jgi:glycosyltransferase involved in cell wall biosynthesis
MSARVIAASEFERRRLVDEGLSASRVVAIPNGIDVDRFSVPASVELKSRFGIPHDTPVVGICAALRPEKNHEMFLEAAATVVRDGTRAKFMIVGGGSRVDHLKARARELGIGADCIFTGSIANVPEAMATFDVGVLSSDREGLPLTILEYMAASLPVVATNIAAIPEAVEDGTNGFLVPPGDHRALAERIARLLSDRELAARMGRAGRRIAEDRFSRHAMIAGIKAVYDDALAAQNR